MIRQRLPRLFTALAVIFTLAVTCDASDGAPPRVRKWTDATGKFSVTAEFVKVSDGKVHLKMTQNGGRLLTLPVERLSLPDQHVIEQLAKAAALEDTHPQADTEHSTASLAVREPSAMEVGDSVVVISKDVKLVDGPEVVGTVNPGGVVIVRELRESRLLVSGLEKPGWLDKQDVVRFDQAVEHFNVRITEDPTDDNSYNARALVWHAMAEYDKAIDDLSQAITLAPSATYYSNRAASRSDKGDYREAIADLDRAIALGDTSAIAFSNRGFAYRGQGDNKAALDDFHKALTRDPECLPAFCNRAELWCALGEFEKAIDDCTRAIELSRYDSTLFNNRGMAWNGLREFDKAIKDLDQAIELDPRNGTAYHNRASAQYALGAIDRAKLDGVMAVKFVPENPQAWANLGVFCLATGNLKQSLEYLTKAIRLAPDSALAYFNRGVSYVHLGDKANAVADFQEAIRIDEAMRPQIEQFIQGLQ
jgi:tetratricopeptide (TPR) repeat protein